MRVLNPGLLQVAGCKVMYNVGAVAGILHSSSQSPRQDYIQRKLGRVLLQWRGQKSCKARVLVGIRRTDGQNMIYIAS